jgi:hypothetical protein
VQSRQLHFVLGVELATDYTDNMSRSGQLLVCILGGFALCAPAATADDPRNPYQSIVDRNVFGLRTPPPTPTNNPEANKPPPGKITLTGIITGFTGSKRALMKRQTPPKPGSPPNEQSLIMTVGQREGEVEVLEINEIEGTAKVSESGNVTVLNLEKPPSSPAAAAVAVAGATPVPAGFAPPAAPAMPNPFNTGGLKTIPTRTLRTSPGGTPGSGAAYGAPQSSAGTALNFGMPNAPQASTPTEPPMTSEESAIMIEAERERLKAKGDPLHMLLPPTPLNPTANTAPPGDATGAPPPPQPRPSLYKNR